MSKSLLKEKDPQGRAYLNDVARKQIEAILKALSPYSLTQLVAAIDNGQVDGDLYRSTYRHLARDGEKYIENFWGCLIGWGAFLENIQENNRFREMVSKANPRMDNVGFDTDEAESFIQDINPGDTPETSVYSAIFRELVVRQQAKIEKKKARELVAV